MPYFVSYDLGLSPMDALNLIGGRTGLFYLYDAVAAPCKNTAHWIPNIAEDVHRVCRDCRGQLIQWATWSVLFPWPLRKR